MDRTEYPAMLPMLQPGQAVEILNDRVRQVGRVNTAIADWLLERRRIEEQYVVGLRKLARSQADDVDLGVFSIPWKSLTNSMNALADTHAGLATKIEVDVERPLREYSTNDREIQALATMQGNLGTLAKDVEKAQQKAEKLQIKGERAESNKMANASSDLDHAQSQWDSQAPYVFESLQAIDETRVNQLRDALTQFLTLEADTVEKSRVAIEQSLNVVLNVETADEIKTFAIKAVSSAGPKPSLSRPSRASFAPAATPSRGMTSSSNLAPVPSNTEEEKSERAPSTSEGKKSGLKGLKRFGTVMRRKDKDKESKQTASALPSTAESPEPDRSRRFTTFGRIGRSKDSYSLDTPQEDEPLSQRPHSSMRIGSEIMEPSSSGPARDLEEAPQIPEINGLRSGQADLTGLEPPKPIQAEPSQAPASDLERDSEGFSAPPPNIDLISLAQLEAAEASEDSTAQHFNVNIRNAPIREEGSDVALASMANRLQAPPPTTRRSGTVRGRRDARNSAIVNNFARPEQPITESAPASTFTAEPTASIPAPAPAPIAQSPPAILSPPLTQSPPPTLTPSQVSPAAFAPFVAASAPQADAIRPSSKNIPGFDNAADNQSIRSGRSATTTTSQGMRHPELHANGINSSIIETLSARFDNGQLSTSSLIGEIALVYNPADFSTPPGPDLIRLDNFATLEKVAPNSAFISQSSDKEGEYTVNLAAISKTQIAFKYQLRADDANSQAPLVLAPAFRIEPTQASIIVSYSLNPAFDLRGQSSVTLSNVMLALTLEGARASNCQSKPVGTFSREKNLIFWQLGVITLTPGSPPQKLLARFATESEARTASLESRWEISSDHAQGVGSGLGVSALYPNTGADPFADDGAGHAGTWKQVPTSKKLVSGSYVAKS